MPIAEIEMPDGRIAEFDVPDGTTPAEIEQYASDNIDSFNTPKDAPSVGGASDARLATYNATNENADENIEAIKTSREFNVTPAEAKIASQELRKQKALEMNYKALTAMELINPSQAENLKQSPEKLSIYFQDNETIRNMSTPFKIAKDIAQSFNLGLDAVESDALNGILFFGGTLSPEQEKRRNEINQAQTDKKDYGLGFVGGIPSAVAGTIPQLASSLFSAETATGAVVGAGIGASVGAGVGAASTAPVGGVGALPGAGIGAVGGAVTGAGRGLAFNILQSQIFSAYGDFRQIKDNDGQNIDDNTARGGAIIAGTIGTALEVVGIKALSKTIPQLKALQNAVTRQGLATVLKNPVSRGYLKTIGDIVAGASAEGVTEALQTLTTEATKEFTKLSSGQSMDSFQGGETNDFFGWVADTLEESLKSGAVGTQAGLGFGVAGTGISKIADRTYKKSQAEKEQNHINDMVSLAEKSELNKKDSALFTELTDNPDKKIYTSVKEFNEFFQDKPDIYSDLQARIPEITEQLNQAIETGGDLILPANKVAQAISALNIKEIVPLMRLTPNSLTETDAIAQINDFDYQENYDVGFERKKEIQDNINFQLQNAGITGIEKDTALKLYSSIYDRAYERTKDSPIARQELDSFINNQIIRQVSDAEQSGKLDDFDLLIERAKILQNKKGKFKQRPLIGFFEKNGGVKSDSSFAGDILSMGVPKRAVKKDSTFRHDAIPVNEFEDYFNIQGVPDDGSGYVDTNFLSDILNQELSGNDWRENFKGDTPNLEAIKLLDTLNRADIDITTTANKDIKKALIGKQLFQEYQLEHKAPINIEGNSSLDNASLVFGDDIYSNNANALFKQVNDEITKESLNVINSAKGKNDKFITIYRSVPSDVDTEINVGDWVTISKEYAKEHGNINLKGDYKIISKEVPANHVFSDGNSINEWGYDDGTADKESHYFSKSNIENITKIDTKKVNPIDKFTSKNKDFSKFIGQSNLQNNQDFIKILTDYFLSNPVSTIRKKNLDDSGIVKKDILKNTADLFKNQIRELFQETQNEFDTADGTPYTEKTIDINDVTRSAVNSNGQPIAQTKEGLENFWNWFGDSKVVDDKGNPLVVYHGTTNDFESFKNDRNLHFFSKSFDFVSKFFTGDNGGVQQNANIIGAYIKSSNPFDYQNKKDVNKLSAHASLSKVAEKEVKQGKWARIEDRTILETIKNLKHDSFYVEEEGFKNIAVFDPTQIKSVFNRGTFDPNDARILFQKQGKGKTSVKRGSFVLLPKNVSIINLFKDRDKSTILHETGHYLLEMYKALANTPDATKDIIDDWNELKRWLEIDGDKVIVDAHESFARGFEAYLMSGKAPSVFLLDIFRTFKRWLVGTYKDVKNLKVNLTPEVKSIFDRMLASEQETEALKNMNIFTPDPEVFKLLTKTEQQDYILRGQKEFQQAEEALLAKKLKELAEKEKSLIQSERDALRQDAEQRIYQSPVHKMRYFFDNGKMPLETQETPIEDVRIDRQKTIDLYGAEFVNLLPSKYFVKDGASPDYASDVFGFSDGGQMLNALVNAPKAKDEIQRTVNEDILNRYGDAFNDDTLERDALDMAHEDLREQGILYEYQIIERTGSQNGKKEVLDNTINDFIALSTKDAINTDKYIRRNAELTGLIEKAKITKDSESIAKYRAEKIQNQTLITQSKKAKEYVNKILAEYKDYAKKQKTNPEDIGRSKQIVGAIESKEYLNLPYNDFLNLAYGIQDIRKDYAQKRNEAKQKSRVNPQMLKERAIEIIHNMTTNDAMQSDKYYRAEVRASAEVQKALSKKDYTGAMIAKERQLLNFYLYRESRGIRSFTNKSLKRFAKYKKTPAAGKVKIDEDYRKQAVALFDMFDFSPRPKSKAGLKAIEEWQKDKQETDGASFLDIDASLFSYDREHYRDMKFSDFYSLVENVESIIAQGRLNRSMEIDGQKQDIAEISEKLTKQVTDNFDTINVPFEPRTQIEKFKRTTKEFFYSTIKARTLLRELDSFKEFGNFYTYFLKPINEASQRMVKRQQKVAETLNGIFDKHYQNRLSGELNQKTFIPEMGQSLSKQAMISYALNYGAVENRQRLLSESNLTEAQLNAVLSQLTKNDYMFIQDVWDFLESFKADIWASEKKRNGIEPQEVQKIGFSVTAKDGESLQLAGGYYPIKYEQEKSSQVTEDTLSDLNNLISNTAQTKRGHTQARLKSVDKPLRNDLGVLFNHVSEVILNLEMGDVLRTSYKLLKKKDLSNAIIRAKGRAFFNQLEWWLQDQAIGGSLGSQGMESILGGLRAGVSIATMGLKVSTVLVQPTGVLQTAAVIGTKYAFLGMAKTFGNGNPAFIKDAFQFAYKNSKILNERAETFNRDVNDALRALETGGKIRQKMTQIAFYPMIKVQSVVDVMAWHGAYQKALDAMGGDETKAIEYADDIVGRTQGSGTIESLSALERGTVGSNTRLSDMVKLFTVYYSYFNTKLNVAYEKTKQTDFKDPSSVLNLATDYLLLFTLEYALGAAILGQLPSDDEDYLSWLMAGTIGNIAGQVPLVRESYSVINGFDGSPSGTRGLKDIGAAGKGLLTATKNAFDEEKDVNIYKLLRDLNMAGGIVFKYPASQMNQTLRAIEKSSDGKDVSPSEYLLYKK